MLDTTPATVTPRSLAKEITAATSDRLALVRSLAVATSDPERDQLRLEIKAETAKIEKFTAQREALIASPVAFERR
jgi:hypothetical protein